MPNLYALLAGACGVLILSGALYQLRWQHLAAAVNMDGLRAGDRYRLTDRAYIVDRDGLTTSIPFDRIVEIERAPSYISIGTSVFHIYPLLAGAFAGQDVEGFCAVLERRWKAAQTQNA